MQRTCFDIRPRRFVPECTYRLRWNARLLVGFYCLTLALGSWSLQAEELTEAAPADKSAEKKGDNAPSEPAEKLQDLPAAPKAAVVAPQVPPTPVPPTNAALYQKTLRSVVWVVVPIDGGYSMGTGWILDGDRKLVVTNHHVVEMHDEVQVFFPAFKEGRVIADKKHYLENEKPIKGRVFDSERKRDLALVELDKLPDDSLPLTLAAKSTQPGESVFSIGNPGGSDALWVYTTGTVRQVYHTSYRLSADQVVDAEVVETQSPTNPGDSGGPVVNERGELVAVVSAHSDGVRLMTTFIDVGEVKGYWTDVQELLKPTTADHFNRRGARYKDARRFDRAISDFTEAIRLDPQMAMAFSNRGWSFAYKGDHESAIGDFDEAVGLDTRCAEAFRGRAYTYSQMGDQDKAIADYTKSIRFNPNDAVIYGDRALAYLRKNEYAKSVSDYTRAIELAADKSSYFNARGDAYYYAREMQNAAKDYSSAIEADPNYAMAYYNRGFIYLYYSDNVDQAITDFTKAVQLNPNDAASFDERGDAYYIKKQYQSALDDYNAALQANPNLAEAWSDRGYLWYYQGKDTDKALADYNRSIELNPNRAAYYKYRGQLYFDQKNYDAAIQDFSNAIQRDPERAEYYTLRGNTYAAQGDNARAEADYEKAKTIDPDQAKNQTKQHVRRYLAVVNKSSEPITVYLRYHTKTVDGGWLWYPAGPDAGKALTYSFKPGESAYVFHDSYKILANKIRIWAVGDNTGGTWYRDREQDVILCDEAGYRAAEAETYTYTFNGPDGG